MAGKRLLQVFLSPTSDNPGPGIFEVNTDAFKHLTCNCPGFIAKNTCKHTSLIERRIEENNGLYPFDFAEKVTNTEIIEAMSSEQNFREFVIKYAKVEIY
jgi:hypothetical protein